MHSQTELLDKRSLGTSEGEGTLCMAMPLVFCHLSEAIRQLPSLTSTVWSFLTKRIKATGKRQKIEYVSIPFDFLIHHSHFSLPSFLFGLKKKCAVYVYLACLCISNFRLQVVGQDNVFICVASHCGCLRMSNDINIIQLTCF